MPNSEQRVVVVTEAVEAAAERVERELGPIDVWVNDAMTTVFAFFEDIEPEEFQRATDVTYHGTVWGTRAALKRMVPRNHGTVVPYTVLGSKFAPWLAERYLARTAVEEQQTGERPDSLNAEGNLMEPPTEDPGAHGRFDDQAHGHSIQWWLTRHRLGVGVAAAGLAALTGGVSTLARGFST